MEGFLVSVDYVKIFIWFSYKCKISLENVCLHCNFRLENLYFFILSSCVYFTLLSHCVWKMCVFRIFIAIKFQSLGYHKYSPENFPSTTFLTNPNMYVIQKVYLWWYKLSFFVVILQIHYPFHFEIIQQSKGNRQTVNIIALFAFKWRRGKLYPI